VGFILDKCTLRLYDEVILTSCKPFDCGHSDLNDFFINGVTNYSNELLGKTYCFTLDEDPSTIVCAFTVSNDSIKTSYLPNSRKKKVIKDIPHQKHMKSYPAVLIGRLGVNKDFRKIKDEEQRTGDQLMDFIKLWFVDKSNKTGCRFIVVDSYNEIVPLRYYSNNGFTLLFSSEEQEKEYTGLLSDDSLKTRSMYFDLILLKSSQ
jgi:hypothetical protein